MQRIKTNLFYIWSHFSNTGRSIILALLVVLFFIFVVFTFTLGFLAAIAIIVGAILFFPALITIGYLRFSFDPVYYIFYWIAMAAVLGLGAILAICNVPTPLAVFIAFTVVGWIISFIALSIYNPPR